MVKFALRAATTSTRVVDTEGVVFVEGQLEAARAGDASCKCFLGVALTLAQAGVKSQAMTGVGGSEAAFLLYLSNSFHFDIVSNGLGFPLSFPSLPSCCF